jgi:hypothetical protein
MAKLIERGHGDAGGWRILFEVGLRGLSARITTVMNGLQRLDEPLQVPTDQFNPEQWAIDTDRLIGEIFFGMDSAIECFVFSMNAAGYLKDSKGFCDITTPGSFQSIGPKNIVCGNPKDKDNPRSGYSTVFPKIQVYWAKYQPLIAEIVQYHEVSKHRSCTVFGATPGHHLLPDQPKQPGSLFRPPPGPSRKSRGSSTPSANL